MTLFDPRPCWSAELWTVSPIGTGVYQWLGGRITHTSESGGPRSMSPA